MARNALDGVLSVCVDKGYPIKEPKFTGGYAVEVSPKIAFAIELRKARAGRSQKDIAAAAGMTYQQYQRLEPPIKLIQHWKLCGDSRRFLTIPFLLSK